jgi:cytochrome c oxidase subunit 2
MSHKKIAFVLVLAIGLAVAGCSNKPTKTVQNKDSFTGELKEFNVVAFQWGYEPSTITVNKGDKVRITATSRDVPHGFAINEYGVNLYLDGKTPKTVEFIADKAGTFTIYCNIPCGQGHSSMRGRLIVTE